MTLLWITLGLLLFVGLLHLVAWAIYVPICVKLFAETPWLLCNRVQPLAEGETVVFTTRGGARLEGTYLATSQPRRRGVVLFCHELLGDRWNALPYTQQLRERGFDVFTFDFRNHGRSASKEGYTPMPWTTSFEIEDVRAAMDHLSQRGDADPRGVFVWGVSRGGTAALCALGTDRRVRGMVVDGLVPTADMQVHFMRRFMGIYLRWTESFWRVVPDRWLYWTAYWTRCALGLRRRCRFVDVGRAARRATVPTLLVHGYRDSYVPRALVERIHGRMRAGNRLWIVPKTKHNGAIHADPAGYLQRVMQCFGESVVQTPPSHVVLRKAVKREPEYQAE